jgi:hypothetical protein
VKNCDSMKGEVMERNGDIIKKPKPEGKHFKIKII